MKKILSILFVLISYVGYSQVTYNPAQHTVTNKALGVAQAASTDARTLFYDNANFKYRPYVSTAEVLSYLNLSKYRVGQFDIVINTGGILNSGVITGGTNSIWYFKDGTGDDDLVPKGGTTSLDSLRTSDQFSVTSSTGTPAVILSADTVRAGAMPAYDKKKINRMVPFSSYSELRNLSINSDTSVVYFDSKGNVFAYDPIDNSTADDTAMCIVNGIRRLKRLIAGNILYVDWFGAKGDGVTNDWWAFQKLVNWMAVNGAYDFSVQKKSYRVNNSIVFPNTLPDGIHKFVRFIGGGVTISTTAAISIIFRQPALADLGSTLSNYKLIVSGVNFSGDLTTGQKALEFGCTTGSVVENSHFQNFDTAIVARFWLEGKFTHNFFTNNKSVSLLGSSYEGVIPGTTIAGSAFNANVIDGWSRFYSPPGSYAAIMLQGADQTIVRDVVCEGSKPRYQIHLDFGGSTNVNINTFTNMWIESSGAGSNVLFYLRGAGQTTIDKIQGIYQDTLFHVPTSAASGSIYNITNIPYYNFAGFNGDESAHSGRIFNFSNFGLAISPGTIPYPLDPALWKGGIVPSTVNVDGSLGGNGGRVIASSNLVTFMPIYNNAESNRYVSIRGGLEFDVDDSYIIGTTRRANRLNIGTGGIRLDKGATQGYGFGTNGISPGQYWRWVNDSLTNIVSTGAIRMPQGNSNQRPLSGFSGSIRYNTDSTEFEYANGATWLPFASRSWVRNNFLKNITDRIYVEEFGAVGDGITNDAASFQAMYDWVSAQTNRTFIIAHGHRTYLINTTVNLPKTLTGGGEFRRLKIEGNGVTYTRTVTGPMFSRMPSSQTEALNSMIGAYALTVDGVRFVGNQTAGQIALKLGALYTPIVENCSFSSFDTAIVAMFWLNARIENNFITSSKSVSFKGASGLDYWTGATTSNSAFNIPLFSGNRIYNDGGSYAGISLYASDGVVIRDHISEGGNPRYDIYSNYQGSTVVNGNKMENVWFESSGGVYTTNTCVYLRSQGAWEISNIQNDYPDTLLTIDPTSGQSTIVARNWNYFNPSATTLFDGGGSLNTSIAMEVKEMPQNLVSYFFDNTKWSNNTIGVLVSSVGYNSTNSYGLRSTSAMHLEAGTQTLNITAAGVNTYNSGNLRVYNGTSTVNYNRLEISQQSSTSLFNAANGGANGGGVMTFQIGGANKLTMDAGSLFPTVNITPLTDNTYDLGRTAGPLRWRRGYFGTAVGIGISTTPSQALHVGGKVQIDQFDTGTSADSFVVTNNGLLKRLAPGAISGANIYNSNGTLLANRTVDGGGFNFTLNNSPLITFQSSAGIKGARYISIDEEFIYLNGAVKEEIFETSTTPFNIGERKYYVWTGAAGTWTLPDLGTYNGVMYKIKNAGSGNLTVQRGGSDELYNTSVVTSVVLSAGQSFDFVAGISYWYVYD